MTSVTVPRGDYTYVTNTKCDDVELTDLESLSSGLYNKKSRKFSVVSAQNGKLTRATNVIRVKVKLSSKIRGWLI